MQFLLYIPMSALSQTPIVAANSNSCSNITTPLTPEEQTYARAAWQYFVKNYQPATGFTNSTGGYPSGTLKGHGELPHGIKCSAVDESHRPSRL